MNSVNQLERVLGINEGSKGRLVVTARIPVTAEDDAALEQQAREVLQKVSGWGGLVVTASLHGDAGSKDLLRGARQEGGRGTPEAGDRGRS